MQDFFPRLTAAGLTLSSIVFAATVHAETFQFTGNNYGAITNFTACTQGSCANYTPAMRVAGQFSTAAPLAPNLLFADIYSQVTAFQFTDGINVYSSTAPGVRPSRFQVSTNALGEVTASDIIIGAWQDNLIGPHTPGDRHNVVTVSTASGSVGNNNLCTSVTPGPLVPDNCVAANDSSSSSVNAPGGAWTMAPTASVPTLSEWALALMAGLLAGIAIWHAPMQRVRSTARRS